MISLTGAGGKTTLLFRLAQELLLEGKRVITTTTTKIREPSGSEGPSLFVSEDEEAIQTFVKERLNVDRHCTLATQRLAEGKLQGISPDLANTLWNLYDIDVLIIEADGAAGRPIKAPREREPVIPKNTTLVVAILGLDGLGKELNDQNVFQTGLVSKLTGIPEHEKMTEEGMAQLMTHPQGLFKGTPPSARRIGLLNKMDVLGDEAKSKAEKVAQLILKHRMSYIERVLLGQLMSDPPVVEILFP